MKNLENPKISNEARIVSSAIKTFSEGHKKSESTLDSLVEKLVKKRFENKK